MRVNNAAVVVKSLTEIKNLTAVEGKLDSDYELDSCKDSDSRTAICNKMLHNRINILYQDTQRAYVSTVSSPS